MKRLFWILLILVVLGLGAWSLSRAFIPTSAYAHVTHGQVMKIVTGSVTVSAAAESQITSPENGTILPANFSLKEGQPVAAGDVLARLDPGEIPFLAKEAQLKLDQANRQLAGKLPSEIDLARMQNDLADKKQEADAGFVGKADYAELELQVASQQALATKERSDLETQKNVLENSLADYADQLRRLDITAPYDGSHHRRRRRIRATVLDQGPARRQHHQPRTQNQRGSQPGRHRRRAPGRSRRKSISSPTPRRFPRPSNSCCPAATRPRSVSPCCWRRPTRRSRSLRG